MAFDAETELLKLCEAITSTDDSTDTLDGYALVSRFFGSYNNPEELAELIAYTALVRPSILVNIVGMFETVHKANESLIDVMKLSVLLTGF